MSDYEKYIEKMKNLKPHKKKKEPSGLEDLAYIKNQLPFYDGTGFKLEIDESDFKTIEKELKAFDIISKRFGSFILTVIEDDLRTSKEERNLLKEVLYGKEKISGD